MTKPYENMKTEKRLAKVGERVRGTITGREATVVKVEKKSIEAYYEGEDYSGVLIMPHENYEVITEDKTEALQKEIEILRNERDDARKKLKTLNDGIGDYRTRIERQKAAIQSLQEKEKEAEEKIEHLEHRSAELDAYNDGWKEQNQVLRNKNLNLSIRMRELREDHAATEDRYQQEIKRLNGIIDTIQNYVKGLEVGVK